eukprot:gene17156-18878_t
MEEFLGESGDGSAYSAWHMKEKIMEHFGENVIITNRPGKTNIVTFRRTVAFILQEFHSQQKEHSDPEDEKFDVIRAAAKLLRSDIKLIKTPNDYYPLIETGVEKHIEFLPPTLKLLLKGIFSGKKKSMKVASIGQAVMQSSRRCAILTPLQMGLAVQLHHSFASRFLIDTLHRLGFCSSYREVFLFKQNAAVDQGTGIPEYSGQFVQYVADNVNLRTIDGHNTFHGMGMIATVTPGTSRMNRIPRKKFNGQDIVLAGNVRILPPSQPRMKSLEVKFKDFVIAEIGDPTNHLDVLWKTSLLFNEVTRPSWAGLMQATHKGIHNDHSSISFLPMIDMSASDITCINSTLCFIYNHAQEHVIQNPIITWFKAFTLINTESDDSKLRHIIPRLGSFHTLMSFLSSIGHLMAGSGLKELLELIYAPNAVEHMLSGKAVARALRGHLIVDASLNALLYSAALDVKVPYLKCSDMVSMEKEEIEPGSEIQVADENILVDETAQESRTGNDALVNSSETLYKELVGEEKTVEEVSGSDILNNILTKVFEERKKCQAESRTAALWLQYLDMLDIVHAFMKAESTGNWEMHLQSARLYLQSMNSLKVEFPDVYKAFARGFHVVRRSDRYWAGLSTDLIIEPVLMRSLKTTGGLTQGSGMTEQQRAKWLLSTPACAQTSSAMQDLIGVLCEHSEQNKDMSAGRQKQDLEDTIVILKTIAGDG